MNYNTNARISYWTTAMGFVLWIMCLTWGLTVAKEHSYSKQSKSFFFPKYRPEIFYDNKVLPEDIEVDAFIIKDQIQRLFYVLEGGYRPLSITITPCSSTPLEWKLSHQLLPTSAGNYSDPWYNLIVRPDPIISPSPSVSYSGTERRSYSNPRAPPGLYILELDSPISVQAKVVVTTRSCTDRSYHPPLPSVRNVQLVKAKRNRVLVSWKPSSSNKPVEYCITSNTAGNYNSYCAAKSDLQSTRAMSLPAGSGFGFHWEQNAKKTIQSNFVTDVPKNNASLICVGRKTWHMFRGLERGTTYYFDVFAVDSENNASTAYVGVRAIIKNGSKIKWIKDDALMTYNLDTSNGYSVTFKYHGAKAEGPIYVFVQSCTGPGPVILTLTQNNVAGKTNTILTEHIMNVRTLEVANPSAASNRSFPYLFNIGSSTKLSRSVRIWISRRKHSFPYPILPADKNIKVFDSLITCDSITIGWTASPDEKVKYCIYRNTVRDEFVRKALGQPRNYCEEPVQTFDSTRTTVLCRRYHRFSKRRFNNVIMQRVRGLEPGTTYLFEVQVTKVNGKMIPYEQVWASTRKKCSHVRTNR